MDDAAAAEELNSTMRQGIMAQRLAGKSDKEILESDLVRDLLRANADLLDGDVLDDVRLADLPKDLPGFQALPSKGEAPWGRWSQTEDKIALEIFLEEGVRGRDLRCEVRTSSRDEHAFVCAIPRAARARANRRWAWASSTCAWATIRCSPDDSPNRHTPTSSGSSTT